MITVWKSLLVFPF